MIGVGERPFPVLAGYQVGRVPGKDVSQNRHALIHVTSG
jgi:hypothetical protein